jgi:hypothetical protein
MPLAFRSKSATTKLSEEEHSKLAVMAESRGQTLSVWMRERLLESLGGNGGDVEIETTVIAELLAFRRIVITLIYEIGQQKPVTKETVEELIEMADSERFLKAQQRLAQTKLIGVKNEEQ